MDEIPLFPPTSRKEAEALGWDYIDVILFCGDAYIDHPSFGVAVIARVLGERGYRVAVVPQPNWRDDLRDFKKFGEPRLFFGVSAGAMDSMVNHYTAHRRLRSNDAYTPDGKAGARPDYAVTVYSQILKKLYPHIPLVLGGIEASLRRLAHYDYWSDTIKPSILLDSGADLLIYGMGEQAIVEIADRLNAGEVIQQMLDIPQIAYLADYEDNGDKDRIILHGYEECVVSGLKFAENFRIIERESNSFCARHLVEPVDRKYIHVNSPYTNVDAEKLDSYYALPFTRKPHPRYKGKHIPAYEMIRFSITTHRGCFGSCAFCTISAHQGKYVVSRSEESILREAESLSSDENFRGVISDVGGPTANMYGMRGKDTALCKKCIKDSCIYPRICPNLEISHARLLALYRKISSVPGVRKSFVGSGIRYDMFLNDMGYLDNTGRAYLEDVVKNHTSGIFKVAPEHTEDHVLRAMGKPSFRSFRFLRAEFDRITRSSGLKYHIIPYFMSSHPACTSEDMLTLSQHPYLKGIKLDQVQDFTPTPMTRSSVAYCTGIDPKTLKPIYVETDLKLKIKQKSFFFKKN